LQEFTGDLERIVRGLGNAEYIIGAATSRRGNITINVHPDLVGPRFTRKRKIPT